MNLRDMLRKKKKSRNKISEAPIGYDDEKYPYGLQIRFEKEDLDKLKIDIKSLSVDEKVSVVAIAEVTDINQSKSRSGERQNLTLQITKMDVTKRTSLKDIKKK